MYNVDTLVDDAVKQTKTGLAHVPQRYSTHKFRNNS